MSDLTTCPRCDPDKSSATKPDGDPGNPGYIFWEEANDQEKQDAGAPDSDNEIKCPLCDGSYNTPTDAWEEWVKATAPSNAPPARFRLEWRDSEEAAHVTAIVKSEEGERTFIIGLLSFHGNGWDFVRIDHDGTQLHDGIVHIDCNPSEETRFRLMEEESRTNAQSDVVLRGHLKAIDTQRAVYRNDTRDLAVLGAHMEARRWWRIYGDILAD